jgi:hypothetical protein
MEKLFRGMITCVLILIPVLVLISIIQYIPHVNDVIVLILISKFISYALLILSISSIGFHMALTRHPRYEVWVVCALGLILSVLGIKGSVNGMVLFLLFVTGVVGVSIFLWFGYERLEELSNKKGWAFLNHISRIISLTWIVSYSLFGLALIGCFLYCGYNMFLMFNAGDYALSLLAAVLSILLALFGIVLIKNGIRSMLSFARRQ